MFNQTKDAARAIYLRLPNFLRRPVNIAATKIRNLERRLFSKKKIINLHNVNLGKSGFNYTLVRPSAGDAYHLSGILYTHEDVSSHDTCLVSISFYDRKNQLIKANDIEVGLNTDSNSHSVKSITYQSGLSDFEVYFTPPTGVSKASIQFNCENGKNVQLISNAYVRRVKKREKNISNILNRTFDFFQSKKDLSFEEVLDFTKEQAEKFGKDVVYLAEIIFDQTRYKYEYLARYFGQVVLSYRPSEWMSSSVYNSFHFSGSIR